MELLGFKKLVSGDSFHQVLPHLFQLENQPQQTAELKATFGNFLMPVLEGPWEAIMNPDALFPWEL